MSRIWLLPTILVVVLSALGLGGSYSGLVAPEVGFWFFLSGVLIAAIGTIMLSAAAAFASATGRAWRGKAVLGTIVPLIAVLGVLVPQYQNPAPAINDITTDLDDPPAFSPDVAAASGPRAHLAGSVPREFREIQQAAYPELGPLEVSTAPAEVFAAALAAAREMEGWEITHVSPEEGTIHAVATTALFRFKDDVVIRVRASGPGARLDLRSRSRVGRGDLGVNAKRIAAFLERFKSAAAAGR